MDDDHPIRRPLAAILAADIAGYSRLMGEDEAATVRDLKGHQAAVLPLDLNQEIRFCTAADGVQLAYSAILGWGKENPAFRQLFTSQFIPGATKEQAAWYNELQRITVSPEVATRIHEASADTDVIPLLPRVSVRRW